MAEAVNRQTGSAADTAPTRVVICGSLRYPDLIAAAVQAERAAGRTVTAWPTRTTYGDTPEGRADIAELWRRLIDEADEVLVVRKPSGAVGESTSAEWAYAAVKAKRVRFFGPEMPDVVRHRDGAITVGLVAESDPQPCADPGMSVDEAVHPMDLETAHRMVQLGAPMPDAVHRQIERTLLARLDEQHRELADMETFAAERLELLTQVERLRADKTSLQKTANALGEHLGAICDALGLSYEAEPDVTVDAIKRLRAMEQRAREVHAGPNRQDAAAARYILGEGPA